MQVIVQNLLLVSFLSYLGLTCFFFFFLIGLFWCLMEMDGRDIVVARYA